MTVKSRIAIVALGLACVALSSASGQSQDPLVGTWQLNVAKSKYSPGPPPKGNTTTITVSGNAYTFKTHSEPASGPAQDWSFTTQMDGKPSKVVGNNANADTVTYTRVDARTYDSISSKGGKETLRQHFVFSADGKTRTVTTTGVDGAGQKISNVSVYDRK